MRIAHCTDIHWTTDVPLLRLPGKRMLGTANQVLRGRRHHFPRAVQQELVEHLLRLDPDLFILTGDLTAQALPEEFELAREDLAPVLDRIPTVILPGNHDVYTRGAQREDRIARYFGPWLHRTGSIGRFEANPSVVFTLDPNRPTFLHASGEVPLGQLQDLREALNDDRWSGWFRVLALHYPLLDRRDEIYDNKHHGLLNARVLLHLLENVAHPPHLILHGHEHHGFRVDLPLGERSTTIVDCGSSGYVHMPEKGRSAAMAIYDVAADRSFTIERYLHDGAAFVPEDGGAFATGR